MPQKKKCPHNKYKYDCRDCNGKGICPHGSRRRKCFRCNLALFEAIQAINKARSEQRRGEAHGTEHQGAEESPQQTALHDCTRCSGTPHTDGCMKCLGYVVLQGQATSIDWNLDCFEGGEERSVFTSDHGEHWFGAGENSASVSTARRVQNAGRVQRVLHKNTARTPLFVKQSAELVVDALFMDQEAPCLHIRAPSLLYSRSFAIGKMPNQAPHRDTFHGSYELDTSYRFFSVFLAIETFQIAVEAGSHCQGQRRAWKRVTVEAGRTLVIHGICTVDTMCASAAM